MPRAKPHRPTDAELEILRVLWDRGPCSARDVADELQRTRDGANANAVGVAVRTMVEKGLVTIADERRPQRFAAKMGRDEAYKTLAAYVRDRIFGGSVNRLVRYALGGTVPTADDVGHLEKLLKQAKQRRNNKQAPP